MKIVTCRARQGVQIGEEVEIAVIAVEPGAVRLGVSAPAVRRLTCIDPVPLPVGASEINLVGLDRAPAWPAKTKAKVEKG